MPSLSFFLVALPVMGVPHQAHRARVGKAALETNLVEGELAVAVELGLIWDLKRVPDHILDKGRVPGDAEKAAA